MSNHLLISFEKESDLRKAVGQCEACGEQIKNVYSPYPVEGLNISERKSRIPIIALFGGIIGLSISIYFQYWSSAMDYRLNLGGKPFFSILPAIPISFEITALITALCIYFGFLIRKRTIGSYKREKLLIEAIGGYSDELIIALETECISKELQKIADENNGKIIDFE